MANVGALKIKNILCVQLSLKTIRHWILVDEKNPGFWKPRTIRGVAQGHHLTSSDSAANLDVTRNRLKENCGLSGGFNM